MEILSIELITYGLGHILKPELIKPIRNDSFVKPAGGLWASPIDSNYGWKEWCKEESFGNLESYFTFMFKGNVFIINSERNLHEIPWLTTIYSYAKYPDFEAMSKNGIDAIWLTEKGEAETRFSIPEGLYGWDCESVLVMNPKTITSNY